MTYCQEAATGCVKKGVLKKTGVSFLIKLQAGKESIPATLFKKKLWYRCFPVSFAKISRTLFMEHIR